MWRKSHYLIQEDRVIVVQPLHRRKCCYLTKEKWVKVSLPNSRGLCQDRITKTTGAEETALYLFKKTEAWWYSWSKFWITDRRKGKLIGCADCLPAAVITRRGIKSVQHFYYSTSSITVTCTTGDKVSTWCLNINNIVHTQSYKNIIKLLSDAFKHQTVHETTHYYW